ncbi:DUF952 domain-containing protein [Gordonia sp. ABSL11-1]|uniref:DUF952 domain-containing protein n=1 Tax=Gordonia sp. ABSL11-1 TaxID=3053924 RepID=UPI002574249D|nr:DUF952 domain-containing protein [Gordonia sp. ABSL11-1]MDL9947724.1 DUF952 domain-containing protein [Gordonia sp. ABSL11-1]
MAFGDDSDTEPDVPSDAILLHLCTVTEWDAARESGRREPDSFADDGFIHLSAPRQVHLPANRLFAGRTDLVLLVIDPHRLSAPVVWESGVPSDPDGMRFPHLYGTLPVDAVVDVRLYPPGPDGTFVPIA